jgi:N-acetylglucosamine kinase-like BadF-type ATPase
MPDFPMTAFKIGVDGGGTKTEFILVDDAGRIVARHQAPGCNPSQVGVEKARAILREGIQALCATLPDGRVESTLLFMAGSTATWREIAAGLDQLGSVVVAADSLPVLELATGGAPGLVLHAGTGSFVAARLSGGVVHYVGGLGWKIGDPGSGFDLGRRGVAHALLELQAQALPGARPLSPLATALRSHLGFEDYPALSRFLNQDPGANAAIAGFAPRVLELAEQDCLAARHAVSDSVTDLVRLADRVVHQLFPAPAAPVPCGISGRVLNSAPAAAVVRALAEKLRWPVALAFITRPPIEGVRRLLAAHR